MSMGRRPDRRRPGGSSHPLATAATLASAIAETNAE
jgi:hypothetical protein